MDYTFREEFYFAFNSIDVEYSKVTMMNDNFYYSFDYDGLNRKLELLLRNTHHGKCNQDIGDIRSWIRHIHYQAS
jgi:hypothetical protein